MRSPAVVAVAVLAAGLLAGPAGTAQAGASTPHTHRVVVRPVDASGQAASGWRVHRMKGLTVECQGSAAAAVDNGIYTCFPTAAYLPSCWASRDHTVLCLRDATTKKLVRVTYTGKLGAAGAPRRPSPQDLVLAGGASCSLRIGGAWGTLPTHPNWLGYYSCPQGAVYGPAHGDGIDRARQPWTVRIWKAGTRHTLVRRSVERAYYVGTHA
jgi:hypothetical protein